MKPSGNIIRNCAALLAVVALASVAQDRTRTRDGKLLFSALDTQKVSAVAAPRISPDGRRVAYTASETRMEKDKEWKTVTQVWVTETVGRAARQYTRGDRSATSPEWSPDGTTLAFLSDREKEKERQVWFISSEGGESRQITTHKGGVTAFRFSPDGKKLALAAEDAASKDEEERKKVKDDAFVVDRDLKMSHLWLWDIEKKQEKRLTEGSYTTSDPRFSPDGSRIAYVVHPTPRADDLGLSDVWTVDIATGARKKLTDNAGFDTAPRWSRDGKWLAYVASAGHHGGVEKTDLAVISAAGGTPRIVTSRFELEVAPPTWSADGKTLFFSTTTREATEVFACDVASSEVRQLTRRGGVLQVADISTDGRVAVGTFAESTRPPEVFRADAGFTSIERITDANAWLRDYALGTEEVLRWTSKDGTEIEGVLTRPVGFDSTRKYPLLLNPHGGPTGASTLGFTATNQVLAANGYLVLQPNFRGSVGRGVQFAAANKNAWGKGDYEDCISGVEAVVARGWADRDRLGAFGWSYGGYMTFWILTQTDMFKAVSPGAGLTNIYSMYSQNDIQRYLRWFYGDKAPWDNVDVYWDRSPMKYVRNVKTPTLILHGEKDTRVPIAQAQEFYHALVERGVPVEFVVFPREGHGFTEPRHQLDRVRRYVAFFGKYLNNPSVTEAAPAAATGQ